ncbi:MAG: ATP synthase F0 subunit B [Terriglobales bacterium]
MPTAILLGTVYILYSVLVHKPLTAVLAERRNRTEGAKEKARADIASAEARTADYEQRLREARGKIFKSQEARRQQAMQARAEVVAKARAKGQEQVKQARTGIEQDTQQALVSLQAEAGQLASVIVRTVLQPLAAPNPVGGR